MVTVLQPGGGLAAGWAAIGLGGILLAGCAAGVADDFVAVTVEDDLLDGKADAPGSVGVELKVMLRPEQTGRARRAFRLRDDRAEEREIWFYDDDDLSLLDGGVVLRARSVAGDDDDSTVKIRHLEAAEVDADWWAFDGFKCEVDRSVDGQTSSCSFTTEQREDEIEDVARGDRDVDRLFSGDQEDFLDEYAPVSVDFGELRPFGPTPALVWAIQSRTLGRKVKFELWTLADGHTLLEASTKVDVDEADDVELDLRDYLEDRNLDLDGSPESKTRAALESWLAAYDD